MKRSDKEPEKPGKDADVLELEEYEKRKNQITVNLFDKPARSAFWLGVADIAAALIGMIWNIVKPIMRGDFMPGFEGWFYGFNVYRIATGYLFAAVIVVLGIVVIRLYRSSGEADESLQRGRKLGHGFAWAAIAMQPISAVMVTVQAIAYFKTFD